MVVAKLLEAGISKERHAALLEEDGLRVPIRVMKRSNKDEVLFEDGGSELFHPLNPLTDVEELCVDPLIFEAREEGGVFYTPGMSNYGPQLPDKDWTPERMGQKFIPRVVIWDEIATVPKHILEPFLDWLVDHMGVQVVCCGDQGQPEPI